MTRDQAIRTLMNVRHASDSPDHGIIHEFCAQWVDGFIALGMLKLDEPMSAEDPGGQIGRVRAFMRKFHLWEFSPAQLESALASCGLKIVEK